MWTTLILTFPNFRVLDISFKVVLFKLCFCVFLMALKAHTADIPTTYNITSAPFEPSSVSMGEVPVSFELQE